MSKNFSMVPLRELLIRSDVQVEIEPEQHYKQITVRLWGKGVILRGETVGTNIEASKQFLAKANQFILSKIDARNGALGIIPASLDGAVVSSDFPVFTLNSSRIIPEFLDWISKTDSFVSICRAASEGTTNRIRLREDRFLVTEIPLPSLEEQQRIVARIKELMTKIWKAQVVHQEAQVKMEAVLQAARRKFIEEVPSSDWLPLKTFIAEIENGWSPACENRPVTDEEWGVLKLGAVSFGSYDEAENKALPPTLEPKPEYEVQTGDFLMSRANTTNLVGACAFVERTRSRLMLSDKIFRFIFRDHPYIERRYLEHVLKSPALRSQIERGATGTSQTMKNISKEKVLNLLIPSHDNNEQQRIVSYLDELQSRLDTLKWVQTEISAALDAILPSILDKAFKGEL